jgi:hypothetical protein
VHIRKPRSRRDRQSACRQQDLAARVMRHVVANREASKLASDLVCKGSKGK